ncbi:hypothetical protein C3K47_08700 [Solitalea longa]|uniref:Tetratricopeptide repeat-like domain-containing protein n=1 Tax=Solitalea longa TaxID=2079460 RepID=A0A2S5A3L4_9SPHI|nr:hypothetical protein [Solitalea longa]POY37126.1 hypothetical protein C3K47_08700 [Solitalea longa]
MKTKEVCLVAFFTTICLKSVAINPDSTLTAKQLLDKERAAVLVNKELKPEPKIERMLKLGMWKEALPLLTADKNPGNDFRLLNAEYYLMTNDFKKADSLVSVVLDRRKENPKALLLKAQLQTWAWKLDAAAQTCEQLMLLKDKPLYAETMIQLGQIRLLQKRYDDALKIAKDIESQYPQNAEGWLLESDILFWNQKPDLAEVPLKKSLELDPFNADARYNYGYAIWRRGDARQLTKMEEQWQLAIDLNPLHFKTHWHWGNGHTTQTYLQYSATDDKAVKEELSKTEELIKKHQLKDAIEQTRNVEKKYPNSVIPAMVRASAYYMAFDMERKMRLDSAQSIFLQILAKKKNYGPAHNGLAAVIKSKRIPYLSSYDSLETVLKGLSIPNERSFSEVFPDLIYYTGETAKKWIVNQLYTSSAYFPLLSKQKLTFAVPPLHTSLATAMHNSYFNSATTFDNRQWMDIRGVGSGAAGIEYVERGAYGERNVLLHEFVHLFHLQVLTDSEKRKIRELYLKAMAENRMLDYYSANNEHEYYAQAYPAYFEAEKVHPLDFKSMCNTADLKAKDPNLYQFIESVVKKEKSAVNGNTQAMKSNWAQVYLNLFNENGKIALLDTALNYDKDYLPALLAYADAKSLEGNFASAQSMISKAESVNANYAPLYISKARLSEAQSLKQGNASASLQTEKDLYLKALSLETDPMVKADLINTIEHFYVKSAFIADAILTAEDYVKTAPVVSTYLRDIKDEQIAFAALLRAQLGYNDALAVLKKQADQKPQNFELLGQYTDALAVNKKYDAAIAALQSSQKILNAAGTPRLDYTLRIAEYYYQSGDADSASYFIDPLIKNQKAISGYQTRFIRLLANLNKIKIAEGLFDALPIASDNFSKADYYYTKAKIREGKGEMIEASEEYKQAIVYNPYHFNAVFDLMKYYRAMGYNKESNALYEKLMDLKIKPGPTFR